jgi:hypothetical protein
MARTRRMAIVQFGIRNGQLSTATLGLRGRFASLMGLTRKMFLNTYKKVLEIRDGSPFTDIHVEPGE